MSRAKPVLLLLMGLALTGSIPAQTTGQGTIIVHVTGFRNDRGHARIGLFNHEDGFPKDSSKALTGARVSIESGRATAVFPNLPYGRYAVIVHHDENDNYKMDRNWLGKPTEDYGASNNPPPRLGPPLWKDAVFELNSDSVAVTIKLHH
jgi:uncharacterized protein (DUF2141 family)